MAFALCLLLGIAPWAAGGAVGWLSGDPTTQHEVMILTASLVLTLALLGR
jgi:hypothetical protein